MYPICNNTNQNILLPTAAPVINRVGGTLAVVETCLRDTAAAAAAASTCTFSRETKM